MTSPMLTFLGAAGTVTGSRFLLESEGERVMVDAGLYQGVKSLRRRNWESFPIDPTTLRSVVLTHAHLDHCGYLPRLVRDGFDGPILCTPETAELAAIVLEDSAHLQEEDARYANQAGFSKHRPALPLYDADDVRRTTFLFTPVAFHEEVKVADGMLLTLRSAGHILGSATATIAVGDTTVMFSGDLGRPHHPLVPVREDPPAADLVVVESTYGDRRHPGRTSMLAKAIRRTIKRGGTVLVPAFAVDRTELVLLEIGELMRSGAIPTVPVHVDSPMALAALRVYERSLAERGLPLRFGIPDLRIDASSAESERLNDPAYPCIVISASGMASGGRVVHHLAHQLPDARNCVVLTGYQAAGTRGRDLAEARGR